MFKSSLARTVEQFASDDWLNSSNLIDPIFFTFIIPVLLVRNAKRRSYSSTLWVEPASIYLFNKTFSAAAFSIYSYPVQTIEYAGGAHQTVF